MASSNCTLGILNTTVASFTLAERLCVFLPQNNVVDENTMPA